MSKDKNQRGKMSHGGKKTAEERKKHWKKG